MRSSWDCGRASWGESDSCRGHWASIRSSSTARACSMSSCARPRALAASRSSWSTDRRWRSSDRVRVGFSSAICPARSAFRLVKLKRASSWVPCSSLPPWSSSRLSWASRSVAWERASFCSCRALSYSWSARWLAWVRISRSFTFALSWTLLALS